MYSQETVNVGPEGLESSVSFGNSVRFTKASKRITCNFQTLHSIN